MAGTLGFEVDSIATVSIGGTSLAGSRGTLIGVIIGVMTLGVIDLPPIISPLSKLVLLPWLLLEPVVDIQGR